ncbi:dUTP diphosphatase [Lysinibacillus sphaericus]|uniref:dUTP diphosphatase n=1 Tax=Lysinibacillus sphaericus TaxID=1421 RepID=UPI0004DF2DB7|nr:dUTP diphosphatase [Lysinibacillus sphaericus]QPA60667.1 dUTP diphosphatase [Lysinibacillus sphaericus]
MNLTKLFETQAKLDEHIMQQHPELQGQNNLDWKLLALQVELGECANEWRGFKKWSKNQEPRTKVEHLCVQCDGDGQASYLNLIDQEVYEECEDCKGTGKIGESNPLLEEYVDCLHFILSVGIDLQVQHDYTVHFIKDDEESIIDLFAECYAFAGDLYWNNKNGGTITESQNDYKVLLIHFNQLGGKLGFKWDEVEDAYYAKNKVNHERQNAGY